MNAFGQSQYSPKFSSMYTIISSQNNSKALKHTLPRIFPNCIVKICTLLECCFLKLKRRTSAYFKMPLCFSAATKTYDKQTMACYTANVACYYQLHFNDRPCNHDVHSHKPCLLDKGPNLYLQFTD